MGFAVQLAKPGISMPGFGRRFNQVGEGLNTAANDVQSIVQLAKRDLAAQRLRHDAINHRDVVIRAMKQRWIEDAKTVATSGTPVIWHQRVVIKDAGGPCDQFH
ncbi:hypothetical protein A6768_11240 [Sphingobium yanoikuyae]|uniref:Uncharacterized protein n=1 Tax=Sphingobium yanoikuyae TaxID=13690 RepID=A0A291MZZ2_SPHYA|nr:hypothetical protein A6768_11240 [Sphingobium yanoikuyae]